MYTFFSLLKIPTVISEEKRLDITYWFPWGVFSISNWHIQEEELPRICFSLPHFVLVKKRI
jgi:hypothetical protein